MVLYASTLQDVIQTGEIITTYRYHIYIESIMGFVWGNITYVITAITLHSTPIPQNASSLISYIFSHLSDTRGPVGIDVRVDFTLYFRHSTIAVSCHLNTCLDTFNGVNTLHLTSFQESFGLI